MILVHTDIDVLVARALELLEREALLLRQRQARLAELSEALARGEADRLERVLEQIDREELPLSPPEPALDDVLGPLAAAVGCASERPALAEIIPLLPPGHRPGVERARAGVLRQARALRSQHMETAILLSQCASFNRALLELLHQGGPAVATYDAGGPRQWRSGGGLVNAER